MQRLALTHPLPNGTVQYTAAPCNTRWHRAMPDGTMQCLALSHTMPNGTVQCPAGPRSAQRHSAMPSSTMQHTTVPCNAWQHHAMLGSAVQCPAAPCSAQQHGAMPGSTVQHTTVPCNAWQHRAVPGSLPHDAQQPPTMPSSSIPHDARQPRAMPSSVPWDARQPPVVLRDAWYPSVPPTRGGVGAVPRFPQSRGGWHLDLGSRSQEEPLSQPGCCREGLGGQQHPLGTGTLCFEAPQPAQEVEAESWMGQKNGEESCFEANLSPT